MKNRLKLYSRGYIPLIPSLLKSETRVYVGHVLSSDNLCNLVDLQNTDKQISTFTVLRKDLKTMKSSLADSSIDCLTILDGMSTFSFAVDAWTTLDGNEQRWIDTPQLLKNAKIKKAQHKKMIVDTIDIISNMAMRVAREHNVAVKDQWWVDDLLDSDIDLYNTITKECDERIVSVLRTTPFMKNKDAIGAELISNKGDAFGYDEVILHNFKIKEINMISDKDGLYETITNLACVKDNKIQVNTKVLDLAGINERVNFYQKYL